MVPAPLVHPEELDPGAGLDVQEMAPADAQQLGEHTVQIFGTDVDQDLARVHDVELPVPEG